MLVDVKYNPESPKPYKVLKKLATGWRSWSDYADKNVALNAAKILSCEPDIPCLIARFHNGEEVKNEVD